MALAVRPAPQLAVELANQLQRRRRLLDSNQTLELTEQLEDISPRWLYQQLASVLPNAGSEKVEPLLYMRGLRLLFRESKTAFSKKGLYDGQDFSLQLLSRAAGDDKVVRVANHVDPRAEIPLTTRIRLEGHRFQAIQG